MNLTKEQEDDFLDAIAKNLKIGLLLAINNSPSNKGEGCINIYKNTENNAKIVVSFKDGTTTFFHYNLKVEDCVCDLTLKDVPLPLEKVNDILNSCLLLHKLFFGIKCTYDYIKIYNSKFTATLYYNNFVWDILVKDSEVDAKIISYHTHSQNLYDFVKTF